MSEDYESKTRQTFIKQSGRMRALSYLARSHPEEYAELIKDGEEEAARRYDRLAMIMEAFKPN